MLDLFPGPGRASTMSGAFMWGVRHLNSRRRRPVSEPGPDNAMARRRARSDADEAVDALGELLMLSSWWVGPLIALGVYLLLRFVLPPIIGSAGEPVGSTFAGLSSKVAPLGALVVLFIWGMAEGKKFLRRRLLDSRSDVGSLRSLSWQEFEQLVGEAYRRQAYAVTESGGGGADGGFDLVLTKDGEKTLVQCKQWRTWKVGVEIVRGLYGVMAAEGAAEGMLVTCGEFTPAARAFAEGKPLKLVNGSDLWGLVEAVRTSPASRPPEAGQIRERGLATASPHAKPEVAVEPPNCPQCGSHMVLRTARKGPNTGSRFYGCSRYPQCRGTQPLESAAS